MLLFVTQTGALKEKKMHVICNSLNLLFGEIFYSMLFDLTFFIFPIPEVSKAVYVDLQSCSITIIFRFVITFNPLTPETFCQNCFFFDILALWKLDRGQISFNLVENALVTRQLAVLVTRIAFKTFQPRHAQNSKF